MIDVKLKKLDEKAIFQIKGTNVFNVYSSEYIILFGEQYWATEVHTGISMEVPEGYVGLVIGLTPQEPEKEFNVLSQYYTGGELIIRIQPSLGSHNFIEVNTGDCIAQLTFQKIEDVNFIIE